MSHNRPWTFVSILPTRPSVSGRSLCASCSPQKIRLAALRPLSSLSRTRSAWQAPAHSHGHYEEAIYGINGVLTWTVDGKKIAVGPGQALCIPRGAIHRFDNNGVQDVRALCVITPAAIGPQYFREAAEVIDATAGGPPDRAKMGEIMRRHGLISAPPSASGCSA
jgi:mannose-6-phosphate isomerase-like protein (cupin superfamily)